MIVVAERRCLRSILACLVAILACAAPSASAGTGTPPEVIERAKRATVGVLEDTQDPRTPDQPGRIKIRGTGFHLRDGYIVTARHAVEKNSPTGHIVPKVIHVLTTDLHELVAQIVGESAYLDVVVYRINQKDRLVLDLATTFATEAPVVGSEVFTVPRWPSAESVTSIRFCKPSRLDSCKPISRPAAATREGRSIITSAK
jgi:serine protease Do